ncbi:hypothetical protein ENH_00012520, partial [Eimeria necatrix]
TSEFLRIVQVVETAKIATPSDFSEIFEDVAEGCGPELVGGAMVTPSNRGSSPYLICDVLLQFASAAACDSSLQQLQGRRYEGKPIQAFRIDPEEAETFVIPIIRKWKQQQQQQQQQQQGGEERGQEA